MSLKLVMVQLVVILDKDSIYYLESRGIKEKDAKIMLSKCYSKMKYMKILGNKELS